MNVNTFFYILSLFHVKIILLILLIYNNNKKLFSNFILCNDNIWLIHYQMIFDIFKLSYCFK